MKQKWGSVTEVAIFGKNTLKFPLKFLREM